jgi:hypothetical protein
MQQSALSFSVSETLFASLFFLQQSCPFIGQVSESSIAETVRKGELQQTKTNTLLNQTTNNAEMAFRKIDVFFERFAFIDLMIAL